MYGSRYTHSCSFPNNRSCRVAAGTNSDIWLKALYYLLGSPARCNKICKGFGVPAYIFEGYPSLKASNLYGLQLIACLRDKLSLHSLGSSCKKEFRVGVLFLYYISNGDTWIDMSSCTAARDKYLHAHAPSGSAISAFWPELLFLFRGFSSG